MVKMPCGYNSVVDKVLMVRFVAVVEGMNPKYFSVMVQRSASEN